MKRGIIYNNGHTIVIPDNEIWMTAWEIADLFYVTPNSINHAVKRVLKEGVFIESQVCWKSHATLTLLAKQDCPLWLQYD